MELKIDDVAITGTRDIMIDEGMDRVSTASFKIPYQLLSGGEDIKIEVDSIKRFWGTIQLYNEVSDGMLPVNAISKENDLKTRQVPYTEIPYTSKDAGWIVKQLLQPFSIWCDTSEISEIMGTISYIHFVHEYISTSLNIIADLNSKYWFWNPIDGKLRMVALGDLTSSTSIDAKYIADESWKIDYTKIYNRVYVKGGHVDGNDTNPLVVKFAWDGASYQRYGLREFKPYIDKEIIKNDVAQKLADALLAKYKDAHITGTAQDMPYDADLKVGETIVISNTKHDGTYLIQSLLIDFEKWTMSVQLSNLPILFEQEIRDIQNDLERLKKSTVEMYEEGKPILIEMELMKKGSSVSLTETYNASMTLPITLPGTIGGLSLISDSIHKRD